MGRRSTVGRAAVVAVLAGSALVGAPGAGPGTTPVGAAVTDPPTSVELPLSEVIALDDSLVVRTGETKLLALGPEGLAVRAADGTALALLPITGDDLLARASSAYVLDADARAILRIETETYGVETFSLAGHDELHGLAYGSFGAPYTVWTSAEAGDGTRSILAVDTRTGVVTVVATGLGDLPLALVQADADLIAVQVGAEDATSAWRFDVSEAGLTPVATATLPPGARAVSGDSEGVLVATDTAALVLRLSDLAVLETVPAAPGTPVVVAGGGIVRGTTAGPVDGVITAVGRDAPTSPQHLSGVGVDRTGRVVVITNGRVTAYAADDAGAANARLQMWDMRPRVTSISPRTIWTRPIDVTVRGAGLAGPTRISLGRHVGEHVRSTDTEAVLHYPQRFAPTEEVIEPSFQSALGVPLATRPLPSLRQLRMGPYASGLAVAEGAHQDIVGRSATPAEAEAIDVAMFSSADPGVPFADLARSDEGRRPRAALLRLYRALLGRWADTAGLAYWTEQVHGGRSLASVARAFGSSPEFAATYGRVGDADYVRRLYVKVLGRSPEPAGQAYWVGQLEAGRSRAFVGLLFSESAEHRALTALDVDYTLLHRGMLGVVPGAGPRATAVGKLRHGVELSTLATELLRSEAYADAH